MTTIHQPVWRQNLPVCILQSDIFVHNGAWGCLVKREVRDSFTEKIAFVNHLFTLTTHRMCVRVEANRLQRTICKLFL